MNMPLPEAASDATLATIDPQQVHFPPDLNPRLRIRTDTPEWEDFVNSIRAQGVIQPIVVRPRAEGGFWLVAGSRRTSAALVAELAEVPAVIRYIDERQAFQIALTENAQREGMTPVEEALAARRVLDALDGDRAEAQRVLGWSTDKLSRRLLIINAARPVLDAYLADQIDLGHVELLSQCPSSLQEGTLARVLEEKMPVADLKVRLASFALDLSAAVFDKEQCQGCPHNSSQQAELFEEHIEAGRCANHECYTSKTVSALEKRREELAQSFNVVFTDVEKMPASYTVLIDTGPQGVGLEQFHRCKGCARFGALLRCAPGHEGRVTEDVCFDVDCNAKMVATYQGEGDPRDPTASGAEGATGTDGAKAAKKGSSKSSAKKPGKGAKTATVAADPRRVVEKVHAFFRTFAGKIATTDARLARAVTLTALWADYGASTFDGLEENPPAEREARLAYFYTLDPGTAERLMCELPGAILEERRDPSVPGTVGTMVKTAMQAVTLTGSPLTGQFTLDEVFLAAHTKAGIESLMQHASHEGKSFVDWYNAKSDDPKAFAKLMKKGNAEIVSTILASGFDFSQFVPRCITSALADTK